MRMASVKEDAPKIPKYKSINEIKKPNIFKVFTSGKNHEFLHSQFVAGMRSAIDDVEGWSRQNDLWSAS
jgi:hypothetical protein